MPEPKPIDWNEELFRDPPGAVKKIVELTRRVVREDYYAATNRERWERDFYAGAPHLASRKELVDAALAEVAPKYRPDQVAEANQEIAELVEKRLRHEKRFAALERERAAYSGGPGFDGPPPAIPLNTRTLGDSIKERNQQRRQAAGRGRR